MELQSRLGLDFDPDAVRQKYRTEREKRLRPEAHKQYLKADGELSSYLDDKHASEPVARAALSLELDVLIIGGGFTGLQTAYWLHKNGVEKFHIVDRTADFGGTWYYNRYPGAACDTEAYCYMPLLEETDYVPSRRFADAEEIFQHARRIGRKFNLYERATFQTTITHQQWDPEARHWVLATDRGDTITARFVVLATGETFSAIKLPGIPGISSFRGDSFHTARWDYSITGGDTHGGLHKLADKKVAIVGTGCSSIQAVPHLGESAKHLYVIQRTPQTIEPRNNKATDPEWAASLGPGWQDRRNRQLIGTVENRAGTEPYPDSGFIDLTLELKGLYETTSVAAEEAGLDLPLKTVLEIASMRYMEKMRKRIGEVVAEPDVAESLKPYYSTYCKRPAWSDTYLETFNRPNVTVVDAPGGVDRVTETGIVANGVEYEVDVIIYGSGYEFAYSSIFKMVRYPIIGRAGVTLEDHWKDRYRNFQGAMMSNFPNYFQQSFVGGGVGANYLYGSGKQAEHIGWIVGRCMTQGIDTIEPTMEAEDGWRAVVEGARPATASIVAEFSAECTPGYMNVDGNLADPKAVKANTFGGGILAFADVLKDWRDNHPMEGLMVDHQSEALAATTSDT
jgi:cyclohexanone monooxygenase